MRTSVEEFEIESSTLAAPVEALLGTRVGKVLAVHLSYTSRAAQRGRMPLAPSWFLKPPSTLALSNGTMARPKGTELLTFEGEIALVIGTRARRVSAEQAWSHVAAVTAANDAGLQDLKGLDRGSNARSKGVDGCTPIGPALLPANEVDPGRLRVRTWLDDELVQDDTTAGLIFSLPELIADLSRTITLEPGDILLTGTPAGSSVAVPGQVISVEVRDDGTGANTGHLRTTVVESDALDEGFPLPPLTREDRDLAWGTTESESLAEALAEPTTQTDAEVPRAATQVGTATLSSQLRRRGFDEGVTIEGALPLTPGQRLVGWARTLRFVANRPDLFAERGGGQNAQKAAVDSLRPGDVLVIEARGERETGTLGDILALRAVHLGAAGVVSDGGIRDVSAVAETGLPVFAQGPHPAVLGRRHVPWSVDDTVTCGGATVQPGDLIVGDDDGVVVVPAALVDEVLADAIEQEEQERFIAAQVAAGESLDGLYPMNSEWKVRYDTWSSLK